jgi:ubiquinone/menaquinone biosynthesis C-methylase UbiE
VPKATYIHGTGAVEQARLVELNRLTNAAFVQFLEPAPDARVLEVGSGLGILAAEVAAAADVRVVGVELAAPQVARVPRDGPARFVQGDAHALPFPDNTFDLVYARYVLEHDAPRPAAWRPRGRDGERRQSRSLRSAVSRVR